MRFEKWQALGNDYIIVERESLGHEVSAAQARALCDVHTGVGADGVLELSRSSEAGVTAELRILNPDGSEAELSGNGVREAVLYLVRHGWTDETEFVVRTRAGDVRPTVLSASTARVNMGRAVVEAESLVAVGLPGMHLRVGNPQTPLRLESAAAVDAVDIAVLGAEVENDPRFPQRSNVSFWAPAGDRADRIRARIWERGVGETASSGTGACGAAIAFVLAGGRSPVTVVLDGGELVVEVDDALTVHLTGWAVPVYSGELIAPLE